MTLSSPLSQKQSKAKQNRSKSVFFIITVIRDNSHWKTTCKCIQIFKLGWEQWENPAFWGWNFFFFILHSFGEQIFFCPYVWFITEISVLWKVFSKTFLWSALFVSLLNLWVSNAFGMNQGVFVCHSKALFRISKYHLSFGWIFIKA